MPAIGSHQHSEKSLSALLGRWAGPALIVLGLFLWLAAAPLVLHLVFLPAADGSRTGLSIESQNGGTICHGLWNVPASGVWRVEAASPAGFDLFLDGKRLIHAPDFIPDNGGGSLAELERGPHLLVIEYSGGKTWPMPGLRVRAPGRDRAEPLAMKDIARISLGNFKSWWSALSWMKLLGHWLVLAGAALWLRRPGARVLLSGPRPARPTGSALFWSLAGLIGLGLYLGAWPLFQAVNQDGAAAQSGIRITYFAGPNLRGGVMGTGMAEQSSAGMKPSHSSLLAHTWLKVDKPATWRFELSLDDYGGMGLGDKVLLLTTGREIPVFRQLEARLNPGLHLLWLECNNLGGPGGFTLKGAPKGEEPRILGGETLIIPSFSRPEVWLKAVNQAKYLGLALLAACLAGLARLHALPAAWKKAATSRPAEAFLAWMAVWSGLTLFLRTALMLDITWPAPASGFIAAIGLASALAGLALYWLRSDEPRDPAAPASPWALVCVLSGAFVLRALFLTNLEYKTDEEGIWHMALNLVRHGVPYLTGIATSQGGFNPPGFLYLLAPAAAISKDPLHAGLYCALIGTGAVGTCFALCRRLAGQRAALAAAALLAASPWAVRYSIKLWPQGFIILLFPLLCLLLLRQNRTSPLWLSIVLGLVAGLTAQLHFTGFLLVAGLALAAPLAGGWPGPKRAGTALAAFLISWAPYLAFLASAGDKAIPQGGSLMASVPGQSALPLWLAGKVLGGMDLASADTLGRLAPEFQAGLWPGFGWLFHAPWLLALGGLMLTIFRIVPAGPVPWLKVFVFAVLAALFGQTALGLLPQMHYAAFVLPWGSLLAGLCLGRMADLRPGSVAGSVFSRSALAVLAALVIAGGAFFWQWQDFLGRSGGSGEYGKVYYLQQGQASALAGQSGVLPTPVPDELCAPWAKRPRP